MTKRESDFLQESNAIEGVYDDQSLQQAYLAWEYLSGQEKMTPGVMLKTHKILMLHQPLLPNEKGYFRQCAVYIGGREGLTWELIESRIKALALKMQFHPRDWKRHHVEYEKIHPFVDGNGRTGRMFLNWERRKAGMPIKVIKESERQCYYRWFSKLAL